MQLQDMHPFSLLLYIAFLASDGFPLMESSQIILLCWLDGETTFVFVIMRETKREKYIVLNFGRRNLLDWNSWVS